MKTVLAVLLLSSITLFGQNKVAEQERAYNKARIAATEKLDQEYVDKLQEIQLQYFRQNEPMLAELADKKRDDFMFERFCALLNNTVWVMEGYPETQLQFGVNKELKGVKPAVWFDGEFKVKSLNAIEFEAAEALWIVRFDFAKDTARLQKIMKGGRGEEYKMFKK